MPDRESLERSLRAMWRDLDAGALRSVDAYIAENPAAATAIRAEHDSLGAWQRTDRSALPPRIGRYWIRRPFARGGMGVLLLGHDPELHRDVVLKTLPQRIEGVGRGFAERLEREARIASRLDHPGICPVLDVIQDGGRLFVVMPQIAGEDLGRWIERATVARRSRPPGAVAAADGRLERWAAGGDPRPAVELLENVALAVHAAHLAGVVHRDLKPANIMVRPDGEPVVLDFGLALDLRNTDPRLTGADDLLGSPHYMAPEQAAAGRAVDARTDVYALGVILYELLTLQRPFSGETRDEVVRQVCAGACVPIARIAPDTPLDLQSVCAKAMSLEPRQRYASAAELAADLDRVRRGEATVARPSSIATRTWRRLRRRPALTAGLGGAVVLVAAFAVLWLEKQRVDRAHDLTAAALRFWQAEAAGRAVDPSDAALLREVFADAAGWEMFLRAVRERDAATAIAGLLRQVDEATRSTGHGDDAIRVVRPRGNIGEQRPLLVAELAAPAQHRASATLLLEHARGVVARFEAVIDAGARTLSAELPAGIDLHVGTQYRWTVAIGENNASSALFRVVSAEREARAARIAETLPGPIGTLASAASLLADGFSDAAARLLVAAATMSEPRLEQVRILLLAQALAELDDLRGLRALAR
jgi:hypothetical protein